MTSICHSVWHGLDSPKSIVLESAVVYLDSDCSTRLSGHQGNVQQRNPLLIDLTEVPALLHIALGIGGGTEIENRFQPAWSGHARKRAIIVAVICCFVENLILGFWGKKRSSWNDYLSIHLTLVVIMLVADMIFIIFWILKHWFLFNNFANLLEMF